MGVQQCIENNDLRKEGILVQATIIEYLGSVKGGSGANPNYLCRFSFKGKERVLVSPSTVKDNGISYVNKTYPALYSVERDALRLLINPEGYNKYTLKYADTLRQ